MRVLWLCNIMLPAVAAALGKQASNKEGWLTGLSERLLSEKEKGGVELGVCFPVGKEEEPVRGSVNGMAYFGFKENTARPDLYDAELECRLSEILKEFQPDVVHVFGTEYPHALAMTRCVEDKERLLVGIQGLCFKYAEHYMADLPRRIQKRYLFRDLVKRDNLVRQQQKFVKRGEMEKEVLRAARHVTGRTPWDRQAVREVNPKAEYHFMNETLRHEFYESRWNPDTRERNRIFVSQGNYPIKGLHYLLQALPEICERFPETQVYVAGDVITAYGSWKEKLKIGSYGKYCLDLIRNNGLEQTVHFVGRLSGEEMRKQYLRSHLFVSPSAIENSPNSVGEAMLLGMPVVSSNAGGVPAMLTDKDEGILYPPGDTKSLAQAVCSVFEDDERARAYGSAARAHALATHDADTNYGQLMAIYRKLTWESAV